MRRDRRRIIQALPALPLALASLRATAAASPAVGSPLALPDLPLLEGGNFRAADAQGKVVVIYWWASWCPYCAEMSPEIEKLWRAQRSKGLQVIGISVDNSLQAAIEHRRKKGYTFPSAINGPAVAAALPKPRGLPVLWVRGKDGRIVMSEVGQLLPEEVAEIARFL